MVAGVGATDGGGVHVSSSSHGQGVLAGSVGFRKSRHGLEVQPQLADVVGHLGEGVGTGGGTGGRVAAGIARVPDVGGVGGDSAATGGGGDHTAYSKSGGTVPVSSSSLGGALRAGVAGTVGAGGAGPGALLVGELDD